MLINKNKIKMLVLSMTGACNFACVYCYASEHDRRHMSFEVARRAVDLAAQSGETFIIQFSGGEPLENYECLQQVVEYVNKNRIKAILQLQTNGSLITKERALYLYKNGCAIGVSLDGRPLMNDLTRKLPNGDGASREIIKGIKVLRDSKIACGITCVVSTENVEELAGIVDICYYLGNIRRIGFDLLRGQGRGTGLRQPSEVQVQKAVQEVYTKAENYAVMTGIKINFAQIERVNALDHHNSLCFGHCYAMNGEAAFVDAGGDIYACASLVGYPEYYLGNVQVGICPQRQGEIADKIRDRMKFCFVCDDFKLCGGGCYARWLGSGSCGAYGGECALKRISIKWYKKGDNK